MEIDFENIFGKKADYVLPAAAAPNEGYNRMLLNDDKTAVLCYLYEHDEKEPEVPSGSCLICLAFIKDDIISHVKKCAAKLDNKHCSICMSLLEDKHLYSNSHAVEVEKMRLIHSKNGSNVGLAKGGELVMDLKGANIMKTYAVYDLDARLKRCKMPKPGGLAAYHLKAAITAAQSSRSISKNMAENSAIVQMLIQTSMAICGKYIPCVTAAKVSYNVNGYSIIELIGALKDQYPDEYPIKFLDALCHIHSVKHKTVIFEQPKRSYNHVIGLLQIITGKCLAGVEEDAPMAEESATKKTTA